MKIIQVLLISLSVSYSLRAVADNVTFPVKGMHCEGCVKTVTSSVCDQLKAEVKSCEVRLIDPKTERGEIKIESLAGKKVDAKRVGDLLETSGYHMATATKASAAITH